MWKQSLKWFESQLPSVQATVAFAGVVLFALTLVGYVRLLFVYPRLAIIVSGVIIGIGIWGFLYILFDDTREGDCF